MMTSVGTTSGPGWTCSSLRLEAWWVGVVGVDVGVKRPCVADQRDAGISEVRISLIRSET